MQAAALLVAVERYADPDLNLVGPADDVIKLRHWMLEHGGVAPQHLIVMASPRDDRADLGRIDGAATLDAVFVALRRLATMGADRIYFYFSGHGHAVMPDRGRQYLLMADFHDRDAPHKAVILDEITDYLSSIAGEYVTISDACRNFPYKQRWINTGTPFAADLLVRGRPKGHAAASGGEIAAARPGGKAYIALPGDEGLPAGSAGESMFTAALLDGLAGRGHAKRWDPGSQSYVVDLSQLQRYVDVAVRSRLGAYENVDLEQVGSAIRFRGSEAQVILRKIPRAEVAGIRLAVGLEPDAVGHASPAIDVRVDELTYRHWQPTAPVVPPVTEFDDVQPRCYVLAAQASGYRQKTIPLTCEPYDDQSETVALVPSGDRGHRPDQRPHDESPLAPEETASDSPGTLIVRSDDPVTPYLVTSEPGAPVMIGAGDGRYSLPAGFFRVRPLAGGAGAFGDDAASRFYDGSTIVGPEWLAQVRPGRETSIDLPSARALPSRLGPALLDFLTEERRRDWFGSQARPPVSSLLALLGEILAADGPLLSPTPARSQVVVLVAVDSDSEAEAGHFISDAEVRFRGPDAFSSTLAELRPFAARGVAVARTLAPPGALTVRVGPADGDVTDVRVPVLTFRPTVLIWHVDRVGRLSIRLGCPAAFLDQPLPDRGRRIDVMQQLADLGAHEAVQQVAGPLLAPGIVDPLASIILAAAQAGTSDRPWTGSSSGEPALAADEQVFDAARLDADPFGGEGAAEIFARVGEADELPVTAAATRLLRDGLRRHRLPSRAEQLERAFQSRLIGCSWAAVWTEAGADLGAPIPPRSRTRPTDRLPASPSTQPAEATAVQTWWT